MAKIEALGIKDDFREILVDDPVAQKGGKIKVFRELLARYEFTPEEYLVIGDNARSEIAAAHQLGMHALLIRRDPDSELQHEMEIRSFQVIPEFLASFAN